MTLLFSQFLLTKHNEKKYFIDDIPLIYPSRKLTKITAKIADRSEKFFGDFFLNGHNLDVKSSDSDFLSINDLYKMSIKDEWVRYYLIWLLKNNHEVAPVGEHKNKFRDQRKNIIRDYVKRTNVQKVLDIGCDDIDSNENEYKADVIFGIDPYPSIVHSHTKTDLRNIKIKKIQKIYAFAECLPFKNNIFDLIVFDGSFDHLLDWKGALIEAKRCLSKNGRIVISVLNWNDNENLIKDLFHFHHFSSSEIIMFMKNKGFKLLDQTFSPWKDERFRNVSTLMFQKK